MPFKVPPFTQIRDQLLRDIAALNPDADTAPDSDYYVRASSIASCASGQYAHQAWIVRQIFPDTADTEFLERHAALRSIYRHQPTFADGHATISGQDNTVIPAGTEIQGAVLYRTKAPVTITSGTAKVAVIAAEAGAAGNAEARGGKLLSPPAGVQQDCELTAMTGGTEQESDALLLQRLLDRLRRPPAGGNAHDYKMWALSVDGVTDAYVFPLRRGLGTVDIVILSGNQLPSSDTIERTQNYIDSVRPVTAKNVLVMQPTVRYINFDIQIETTDIQRAKHQCQAALEAFFERIRPGDGLIVSQAEAVISDLPSVIDRKFIAPAANIEPSSTYIEWLRLGAVEVLSL